MLEKRFKEVIEANLRGTPIIVFTEERLDWLIRFVKDL